MSIAALPYSVLLLLSEFAIGGQLCLYGVDLRGTVTRGFVKMGAGLMAIATAVAFWMALVVPRVTSVDGYPLDMRYLTPLRLLLALLLLCSLAAAIAAWREQRRPERWLGGLASLAALAALGCLSAIVQQPTWSVVGAFLSLLAGGLALGGITLAMALGHWYLVTPRLPEQPLNEMTLGLLALFAVQGLLLIVDIAVPARLGLDPLGISLGQNPAFWLRIVVGLLLASLLTFMAWQSSRTRGMMSATGLLYLATGAVLAGEALACSLLFTTAIPG